MRKIHINHFIRGESAGSKTFVVEDYVIQLPLKDAFDKPAAFKINLGQFGMAKEATVKMGYVVNGPPQVGAGEITIHVKTTFTSIAYATKNGVA